jgi:penicillin-binding protein 2
MKSRSPTEQTFTRRAFVVGAVQAGLLAALGGRLAWLQIVEGPRYATLAEDNRIAVQILPPTRGEIVDATGAPLAQGAPRFTLTLAPGQTPDPAATLRALQGLVDLPDSAVEAALARAGEAGPIEVKDFLSWPEVAAVSVRLPDLPGVEVAEGRVRRYPLGPAAAHVVGYVAAVSPQDIEAADNPGSARLLRLPGMRIGKSGIERAREGALRGAAGTAQVEVNAHGRRVREISRRPPRPGARVALTLHAELQEAAAARLAAEKSASAVVMDVRDGAVYAMASHPSFDPGAFATGLDAATWEGLLADPGHPLTNKAAAGLYPPASTFKMATALAALQAGVADADTRVHCPGHYDYGGHRFHCWHAGGHGAVGLLAALEQSCDVYFYHLATQVGIERIAAMARRLGLGAALGVGLPGEAGGLIPDKAWKRGAMGTSWQAGETIVAAIGQGFLQATPLQLATMTARLACPAGRAVSPYLVASVDGVAAPRPPAPPLGIAPGHMALVRAGMEAAVVGPKATGGRAAVEGQGWQVAGKTGTAQVRRITAAERAAGVRNADLPWAQRHHALFVGYAPAHAPRYAAAVVVEHGVGGGMAAAPVAGDLLAAAMRIAPGP